MGLINVTATWRPASRRAACTPAKPAPTMTTRQGGVASVMCVISWFSLAFRIGAVPRFRASGSPSEETSAGPRMFRLPALIAIDLQALERGRPALAEDRLDAGLIGC